MWGANLSVAGVLLRTSTVTGDLEVLLGEIEDAARLELPKGFLVPDEEVEDGILRVIESESGWKPTEPGHLLSEGYTFDARQTDHAWVESRAYLFSSEEANLPDLFEGSATFDSLGWWPLSAKTMARIPSEQAGLVRSGLEHARDAGQVDADLVDRLLARTG
jgi:ADP-ribose pyrophosphatase YjhB (NUDIX family)